MTFGKAYGSFFKNYVNFTDRTRRNTFWPVEGFNLGLKVIAWALVIYLYISMIALGMPTDGGNDTNIHIPSSVLGSYIVVLILLFIWLIYAVATWIPTMSMYCRRLIDMGLPFGGALALVIVAQFFGIIRLVIFIMAFFPSKYGPESTQQTVVEPSPEFWEKQNTQTNSNIAKEVTASDVTVSSSAPTPAPMSAEGLTPSSSSDDASKSSSNSDSDTTTK